MTKIFLQSISRWLGSVLKTLLIIYRWTSRKPALIVFPDVFLIGSEQERLVFFQQFIICSLFHYILHHQQKSSVTQMILNYIRLTRVFLLPDAVVRNPSTFSFRFMSTSGREQQNQPSVGSFLSGCGRWSASSVFYEMLDVRCEQYLSTL